MKLLICKLKPKSPLHLGTREQFREGIEVFIHSDTLFSAFCHSYLLLYGKKELEKFLQQFVEDKPPFIISSAFPYWNQKLYFPIPENQLPQVKELKKKDFVEKSGFEDMLTGTKIDKIDRSKFIPNENNKSPYSTINVPRVGLSRLTSHPGENYFHSGEVIYKEDAGLFFLYELKDKNIEKQFYATIRLMADEGVGGDRSSGKGLFEKPSFEEIEIKTPDDSNGIITLSLFFPKEEEIKDLSDAYYKFIERKGYIYSPQCQSLRRKSVRMFSEGSIFTSKKTGRMVDVTPEIFNEHRVYRYGLAFSLPCVLDIRNED